MTKGSPLKLMLQFALPLLMGNLLQQTYNIIDAAIVGQILGADALASVGSSSSVQFLVLGFCIGCCAGFGVPVARYFGAGDHRTMRNYIFNGAVLTAIIAAILMIACSLSCGQILHLLSVPDNIFGNAYAYLIVIFIGIPFTLLYNYLSSILRSVGDSRTPFLFLGFSAVLNIFLDLFCIIVLKWGCMGAAIATITAQAISGILCFFYIRGKMQLLRLEKENMIVQKDAVKELLGMGLPMGFQFSITAIGSMVMQAANNGLGSIYVSAFTAAMRIKQFLLCPFDAIGTAASVFCSQNLGARQADRIKKGALEATIAGCIYGFSAGLILIFFGRPLSMIFLSKNATASSGCFSQISEMSWIFLWNPGNSECVQNGDAGAGIFRKSYFLRCYGNDRTSNCKCWICRNYGLYSNLFCRSGCMDSGQLLYWTDLHLVYPPFH